MSFRIFRLVLAIALIALFASTAQGASYEFVGPTYSAVNNFVPPCPGGDCANYTVAMRPRGSFAYLGSLAPNLVGHNLHADPNLLSYGFNDGLAVFDSGDPGTRLLRFQVWTDAAGNITQWWVGVQRWQDNLAGPHIANDRFHFVDLNSGGPSTNYHNLSCGTVGPGVPSGVADACTLFGVGAGSSSADHSNVGATWSAVPTLTINSISGFEGNMGVTTFNFTVSLNQVPTAPVSVEVRRQAGSATAGVDFVDPGMVTLNWGIGDGSSRTVAVQVLGDLTPEPDETFTVRLNNAVGAGLALTYGSGTILNDDAAAAAVPTLSEWALMLLAGLLALLGLASVRRRSV